MSLEGSFNVLPFKDKLLIGPPVDGSTQYSKTTGINISAADYSSSGGMRINALQLTAGTGDIDITFEGGGRAVIPFVVGAGDSREVLRGYGIKTIHMTTTTFDGAIFPIF